MQFKLLKLMFLLGLCCFIFAKKKICVEVIVLKKRNVFQSAACFGTVSSLQPEVQCCFPFVLFPFKHLLTIPAMNECVGVFFFCFSFN